METSTVENHTTKRRSNPVADLFRGDIPLSITYWVFGVLFGNVGLQLILKKIDTYYFPILTRSIGAWSITLFYGFVIAYTLFISIAIWRSSGKYQGRKLWGILARVVVIVNIALFMGGVVNGLQQSQNETDNLLAELDLMNQSLPRMIDDDTRLDHIDIEHMDIYYNYTLVNFSTDQIDKNKFVSMMSKHIKSSQCQNKKTRDLMNNGRTLIYAYRDKGHQKVAEIPVVASDCL
jgi:hypothetical protein